MYLNIKTYSIVVLSFLLSICHLRGQQLQTIISGESEGEHFGYSVDVNRDGTTMIIGARFGAYAKVFHKVNEEWIQKGNTIIGSFVDDGFGYSVSVSADGNIVAVGGPNYQVNQVNVGHARIYRWDGTQWNQLGDEITGGQLGGDMGAALSLSTDGFRLVVADRKDDSGGTDAGLVKIFDWDGNNWVQQGSDLIGEAAFDRFGQYVSITPDGNKLAVGARDNNANGLLGAGHVRVFEWGGSDWIQVGNDLDGTGTGDQFGRMTKLSADGNRIVIGARHSDLGGENAGLVRVFDWDGSDWIQVGGDIFGENPGDSFGRSVTISADGNRIVAGARFNSDNGTSAGHVRIFDWDGSEWIQFGVDIDGGQTDDRLGGDLDLSGPGNLLIVGAQGAINFTGQIHIYTLNSITSIDEKQLPGEDLVLFPNPSRSTINMIGINDYNTMKLFDTTGELVKVYTSGTFNIDISDLIPGLYFLHIDYKGQSIVRKIQKK